MATDGGQDCASCGSLWGQRCGTGAAVLSASQTWRAAQRCAQGAADWVWPAPGPPTATRRLWVQISASLLGWLRRSKFTWDGQAEWTTETVSSGGGGRGCPSAHPFRPTSARTWKIRGQSTFSCVGLHGDWAEVDRILGVGSPSGPGPLGLRTRLGLGTGGTAGGQPQTGFFLLLGA